MISNQNKSHFVKTTVKGIRIFPGWREALEDNWQQDFQNLYSSIDEALRECYKFYPQDEVDTYGIIVYEIKPLKTDILQSSILIDTNIIIKRETADECVSICKNRSVFTEEEIREMHKTRPIVIKLLDYMPFATKVTLDQLRANGIVAKNAGPRPFNQISKEQFEIIYRLGMEA